MHYNNHRNIQIIDQELISLGDSFPRLIYLIYGYMIVNDMQKNEEKK